MVAALFRDPRAVRLSGQLRAQAQALAARNITSVAPDYIDEVADQLVSLGIDDLTTITGAVVVEYGPNPSQLSMIGTEGEPQIQYGNYPITRLFVRGVEWPITIGERAAWNHDGTLDPFPMGVTQDGRFYIVVKWIDPPGAPLVLLVPYTRRSPWRGVAFMAGFIAAAAGLPALIGEAVLGAEVAAAYPNAAQAIGTVATRTVLTGGDVESALRSAATGFAGAEFGDVVGQAVDSPAFGAAAAAATSTALAGGDARSAALAAVQGYVKTNRGPSMSDYDPNDPYLFFDPSAGGEDIVTGESFSLGDLGLSLDVDTLLGSLDDFESLDIPADAVIPDDVGNLFAVDGSFVELSADEYINSLYPDSEGNIRGPDNRVVMPSDEVFKYLGDPPALAVAIENKLDLIAGSTMDSWQPPELRPLTIPPAAAQTRVPVFSWADQADKLLKTAVSIGASIKAISSGTFRPPYATSPYGTPRSQVGVPVRRPDGSTVVNNGNGTQTIRFPDGSVQTMPTSYTTTGASGNYGQGLIPGIPNTALLIGGGLVVAALLISRR